MPLAQLLRLSELNPLQVAPGPTGCSAVLQGGVLGCLVALLSPLLLYVAHALSIWRCIFGNPSLLLTAAAQGAGAHPPPLPGPVLQVCRLRPASAGHPDRLRWALLLRRLPSTSHCKHLYQVSCTACKLTCTLIIHCPSPCPVLPAAMHPAQQHQQAYGTPPRLHNQPPVEQADSCVPAAWEQQAWEQPQQQQAWQQQQQAAAAVAAASVAAPGWGSAPHYDVPPAAGHELTAQQQVVLQGGYAGYAPAAAPQQAPQGAYLAAQLEGQATRQWDSRFEPHVQMNEAVRQKGVVVQVDNFRILCPVRNVLQPGTERELISYLQ